MKAELLERLLDGGFSKDEIIQLARDEPIKQEGDIRCQFAYIPVYGMN